MSKLFIFAVGGTGSRVVKALTMLLASGVELKNTTEVIPIIVDPHKANKDLQRTENILKNYKKIRDSVSRPSGEEFFSTEIKTLGDVVPNGNIESSYTFQLKGVSNETFGNYIDFENLSGDYEGVDMYSPNKDLASLLFSKGNLETEMNIGFVGNPNIGSVVLNQFKESEAFVQFAANFSQNDRIFIISSIFGGTGAAGFPIILKNIRAAEAGSTDNSEHLKNAKIGALTVLPYFGIEPNAEKKIDKATFYSKTKAALQYYTRGVNKSVNQLYYIGDELNKNYTYDPGDNGQQNEAHFIEMAAAMAIIDFAAVPDSDMECRNGLPTETVYKEFGIKSDNKQLDFSSFFGETLSIVAQKLTKLTLLNLYLEHRLKDNVGSTMAWYNENPKIDQSFLTGTFNKTYLTDFKKMYFEWLKEMSLNNRSFESYNLGTDLSQLLVGYSPKKGFLGFGGKTDFPALDEMINTYCRGKTFKNSEEKFLKATNNALDVFLVSKFPDVFKNI